MDELKESPSEAGGRGAAIAVRAWK